MRMRVRWALAGAGVLAGFGSVSALGQRAVPTVAPPEAPRSEADATPGAAAAASVGETVAPHSHGQPTALGELIAGSERIADVELIAARATIPEGLRVVVTEYTFRVHEWLRGGGGAREFTVRETGGIWPDGAGMGTCVSHRLEVGGRYVVFVREGTASRLDPFAGVLQALDGGSLVADPEGRTLVGIDADGEMRFDSSVPVRSARYTPPRRAEGPALMGPPETTSEPLPAQEPASAASSAAPVPVERVLERLREAGASAPTAPSPMGLPSDPGDYSFCGWINNAQNFYANLPVENHWNWFNTAGADWNFTVTTNASGPDWLVGHFLDANNNPIRNRPAVANNGQNNVAVPDNTARNAGGYGAWPANTIGQAFWWWPTQCGRFTEADALINPVIANNERVFRNTMTHELGHTLCLEHEDRTVNSMHSIADNNAVNYATAYYARAEDFRGVRAMLRGSNNLQANTWVLENTADATALNYTHPNVGVGGGYALTSFLPSVAVQGSTVTLSRMHVENRGNLPLSNLQIKVYLSTNTIISASDIEVWSGSWSTFGAETAWTNGSASFTVPSSLTPGTYYVGYVLTTPTAEITTANNTTIVVNDLNGALRTLIVTAPPAPANNACSTPTTVTHGTYLGTTRGATNDGTASCGASSASPDVWFRYVAPCSGYLLLDTCGSTFDTVLSVQVGCGPSAVQVACNDDSGPGFCPGTLQSTLQVPVVAGREYRIRLSGYAGATGDYALYLNPCVPCPGDANGDGFVNFLDMNAVLAFIGQYGPLPADLNNDGMVNFLDLNIVLANTGRSC